MHAEINPKKDIRTSSFSAKYATYRYKRIKAMYVLSTLKPMFEAQGMRMTDSDMNELLNKPMHALRLIEEAWKCRI